MRAKCTEEITNEAVRLKKNGLMDKDIAAIIGISPETFCRWCNDPKNEAQRQFSQAIKNAEGHWRGALEQIILKAAKEKDWKAAAWLLERKNPELYSLAPSRFEADSEEEREKKIEDVSEILVSIKKACE